VDSFIYSPLLDESVQGLEYGNLMHVSDWFPTILSLVGVTYTPGDDFTLDGVDQSVGWADTSVVPRTTMLYNYYTALTDYNFNLYFNGSMAVRDDRYKLLHTYNDSDYAAWYDPYTEYDFDFNVTNPNDNRCAQQFLTGDFEVCRLNFSSFHPLR
jgi:arylsulfatase A-like enzyme